MIRNPDLALRALHEVLVAARNISLEKPGSRAIFDIVDSIEAVPLWIADKHRDLTEDFVKLINELAKDYPECAIAASTVASLDKTS